MRLFKIMSALVLIASLLLAIQATLGKRKTDYDDELNKIQSDITNAKNDANSPPNEAAAKLDRKSVV